MINENKLVDQLATLKTLKKQDEVTEVRIPKTDKGTISGYFDDDEMLVQSVKKYIGKFDIYITLNPVKKELLARCNNRLQPYAKTTSTDGDIEKISLVLIDIDPVRASGISSSENEKKAALDLIKQIRKDLVEEGFPKPIVADSGNGYHLLLSVDLENTKENVEAIKAFLSALDFLYSTDEAQVDVTTYNPSRIVKFYGTKACKGDDTNDRPHRWSKLAKVPKQQNITSLEQIEQIVAKKPKVEATSNKKVIEKTLDIGQFIEKHDLELAYKASYGKNSTKYILDTCPWNSDHTDRSAYIIQFDGGGIAAGCHHNSCREENWKTLRELLEDDSISDVREEEKQSDIIIKLAKDFQYFRNDIEEPFVAIQINGHWEVMEMKSQKFKLYLTKIYFENVNSAPGSDAISQALKVLEMKAIFSENERTLQKRVAEEDGSYYYDLCDVKWRAVKVNEEGCSIEENPPILFTRNRNMKEQVEPDFSVQPEQLIDLVKKHFRFKKQSDMVLFSTYLVSCFLPEIAHVILVLFGEKGAAKSTTMRMVKRIVDPAMQDLLSLPTSKSDLAIVLSNNYMPCFDNLDTLSAEKSDMLCMAATGGAFTKRTLYSDSDETILRFKRSVALNGINIAATRPDLLDRSIVLELERIPKTERQSERTIWKSFEADIPKFLGAIFNAISAAIPQYDETKLREIGRMADLTYWGYAIAEVLGLGGDEFRKSYLSNQDTANEEALASHPVATAVIALLKNKTSWSGSVSSLLKELERTAEIERINTRVKTWAKDPNVLSKRLKEVKSNLEEIGIYYDIRHAGDFKKITLERHGEGEDTKGTRNNVLRRPLSDDDEDFEDWEEQMEEMG